MVSGSLKMLSDDFSAGQEEFAANLVLWACKARGVIQPKAVKHHLVGQTQSPEFYTINEDVHYEMDIQELVNVSPSIFFEKVFDPEKPGISKKSRDFIFQMEVNFFFSFFNYE